MQGMKWRQVQSITLPALGSGIYLYEEFNRNLDIKFLYYWFPTEQINLRYHLEVLPLTYAWDLELGVPCVLSGHKDCVFH